MYFVENVVFVFFHKTIDIKHLRLSTSVMTSGGFHFDNRQLYSIKIAPPVFRKSVNKTRNIVFIQILVILRSSFRIWMPCFITYHDIVGWFIHSQFMILAVCVLQGLALGAVFVYYSSDVRSKMQSRVYAKVQKLLSLERHLWIRAYIGNILYAF